MSDKQIKMLSLWQPWASLCVWTNPDDGKAEKQVETRHWSTNYRGLIAIHATKTLVPDALFAIQHSPQIQAALIRQNAFDSSVPRKATFTTGAIIGVVTLEKIVQFDELHLFIDLFPFREKCFGDYTPGRFGWLFTNPIEFDDPIYCRGLQSLGTPTPEIQSQIFERLELVKQ